MFNAAPEYVQNAPDIIFLTPAWRPLIKADVRFFFPLNPYPPLDTNHTETQYKNWGRTGEMHLCLKSLLLTPRVDPVIADNIQSFCVVFASR